MPDINDWRLTNQMEYLYKAHLVKLSYFIKSEKWEHDHCEFCWIKFNGKEDNGYCTSDRKHWICESCFDDFKNAFKWKTEKA